MKNLYICYNECSYYVLSEVNFLKKFRLIGVLLLAVLFVVSSPFSAVARGHGNGHGHGYRANNTHCPRYEEAGQCVNNQTPQHQRQAQQVEERPLNRCQREDCIYKEDCPYYNDDVRVKQHHYHEHGYWMGNCPARS